MKKGDVKVGQVYAVKVSGDVVPVVIDEEHPNGGWTGTNQHTNRHVRVKTAQRLRCPWGAYLDGGDEPTEEPTPEAQERAQGAKGEKKASRKSKDAKAEKRATRANGGDEGGKPTSPRAGEATKAPMSGLDAAAKVLEEAGEPLNCKAIVERAFAAGHWQSDGKTPADGAGDDALGAA